MFQGGFALEYLIHRVGVIERKAPQIAAVDRSSFESYSLISVVCIVSSQAAGLSPGETQTPSRLLAPGVRWGQTPINQSTPWETDEPPTKQHRESDTTGTSASLSSDRSGQQTGNSRVASDELLMLLYSSFFFFFFFFFCHFADAFIQSDLQLRTLWKQSKPTKEQQHASAITSPG